MKGQRQNLTKNINKKLSQIYMNIVMTDLVDSTVEERPWDVERLLRANVPITSHILTVDEDHAFAPALK